MKKYKLLIFDFDGTLVDTIGDIAYYANETLARYGYPKRAIPEVRGAVGWGVHELLRKLAPDFQKDAARLEEAVEFFKKGYNDRPVRFSKAYPFVREMLGGPLKTVQKAIVTNKPQDITIAILKELGLHSYFPLIVGLLAGFPPKPDPQSVLHVMKIMGAPAEETLFIGDSDIDSQTSFNAGIDFGWAEYGYDRPEGRKPAISFPDAAGWAGVAG